MRSMKSRSKFFFMLIVLALLCQPLAPVWAASTAVTLISFSATPDDPNGVIIVTWLTGSELDTAGFYILRSTSQNAGYARVNAALIPSAGEVIGSEYTYTDSAVVICTVYFYRIEAVDNSSHSQIFQQDPGTNQVISAVMDPDGTCASQPTPTNTNTPTQTNTPTRTATPTNTPIGFTASPTPTPTQTATPTVTRTPAPTAPPTRTNTPAPTSTQALEPTETATLPTGAVGQITATLIPTATATLEPLPPVSLVFPAEPTLEPAVPAVTVIVVTPTGGAQAAADTPDLSNRLLLLLGVVAVLWVGLMAFMVVFLRKSNQ